MQVNRFWASVGSAVAYLFGIGLLLYLAESVVTLFGLFPGNVLVGIVQALVPLAGTLAYVEWRWGWTAEHIGLVRRPAAAAWALVGIAVGVAMAVLSFVLEGMMPGGADFVMPTLQSFSFMDLFWRLFAAFSVELIFRGAVISRYQADMVQREVVLAAILTPFAWQVIQAFLGFGILMMDISNAWTAALSVALTMIFLRTDSVWFSTGLRFGVLGSIVMMGKPDALGRGGLLVWGTIAVVLLILEWLRQQRMPRRPAPGRSSHVNRSRTVRGPWGPH